MGATTISGPSIVHGIMTGANGIPDYNEVAGPSIEYQGDGIPDVRFPLNKDNIMPGSVPTMLNSPYFLSTDAIPQTLSATNIVNAQAVAGAGAVTLVTNTSTKAICNNVPIVPLFGTTAVNTIGIDVGFQTVNTNGTTTVTIAAGTANRFPIGQWLWIAGAAGAAGTFTRVTANAGLSTTTTITVSTAPGTNATAPVCTTNLMNPYLQTANAVPTSVYPWTLAGAAAMFDPTQGIARCLQYKSSNAGDTTQTVTARGWDVYLTPMTETATLNGTNAVLGKKAFKYVASVTASAAMAGNLSVGTQDVFGINARSDFWEYLQIFWAGAFVSSNVGWTAGDQATPTATTGDVRGTYAVQSASNGTNRIASFMTIPLYNLINTTPATPAPTFGNTQFAG